MPDLKLVAMMLAYWGSHIYPWKIIRVLNFKPQGNGGKFQRSTKLNLKPSYSLLTFLTRLFNVHYLWWLIARYFPAIVTAALATRNQQMHTSSYLKLILIPPPLKLLAFLFFLILYLLFIPLLLKTWHHWLTAWLLGKGLDFEQSDANSIFPKACYV